MLKFDMSVYPLSEFCFNKDSEVQVWLGHLINVN